MSHIPTWLETKTNEKGHTNKIWIYSSIISLFGALDLKVSDIKMKIKGQPL